MIFNTKKFNKEIAALKGLSSEKSLHPLKKEQIKRALMENLDTVTEFKPERYTWAERRNKFMRYVISTLLGLSLVGGTAFAANNAKPGDILFPVKKATEKVQVSITASEQAKAELQAKFAEKRLKEQQELKAEANAEASAKADLEVSNAITTLKGVKADLEAKGNTTAAAAIGQTIVRLENKQEIENEAEAEDKNEDRNHSEKEETTGKSQTNLNATTSSGSNLHVNTKIENEDSHEGEDKSGSNSGKLNLENELELEHD